MNIDKEIERLLEMKTSYMDNAEIIDRIYDTLFENTQFPQFDTIVVEHQEVERIAGEIRFELVDGRQYLLKLFEV